MLYPLSYGGEEPRKRGFCRDECSPAAVAIPASGAHSGWR